MIQLLTVRRESFKEMMESVKNPFSDCIDKLVKNIKLDPGFKDFFNWASENNIPVVVLSSGMEPIIRALLSTLVDPESNNIQIVGNTVKDQEGDWELEYHDDRWDNVERVEP